MTKEAKMQIVIDNYFKSECDVNTSIRKAFEKGFRIGVQKGSVDADPVKHGHWIVNDNRHTCRCSCCESVELTDWALEEAKYCPHCGAYMGVEE